LTENTVTTTPRLVKSLTQVNTSDAPVNPDSDASQLDGQIAPLLNGGYVVVWTDGSGTHNFSGTAIVGQRYDSLGNKVGGEVKISQFSSGDQSSPAITALPNGNVAIAFVDSFLGNQDLIVRIFGTDWHVEDIGDYNNDGKSDILWRHDSGQVYTWEMNGLQIAAEVVRHTLRFRATGTFSVSTTSSDTPSTS
jgi:hypothetical protein